MFAKESNTSPSQANFASDQTVQTKVEDGKWMSLREASDATGLSEKTISRHIKKKLLKRKKLGTADNAPVQVWITDELRSAKGTVVAAEFTEIFEAEADDDEDDDAIENFHPQGEASIKEPEVHGGMKPDGSKPVTDIEGLVRVITQQLSQEYTKQFVQKLDEQKEVIHAMRSELQEKDAQLKLLPDFQRQLEEKENLADFQSKALQTQIDGLKQENERLRQEADAAKLAQKQNWWSRLFSSASAPTQAETGIQ